MKSHISTVALLITYPWQPPVVLHTMALQLEMMKAMVCMLSVRRPGENVFRSTVKIAGIQMNVCIESLVEGAVIVIQ